MLQNLGITSSYRNILKDCFKVCSYYLQICCNQQLLQSIAVKIEKNSNLCNNLALCDSCCNLWLVWKRLNPVLNEEYTNLKVELLIIVVIVVATVGVRLKGLRIEDVLLLRKLLIFRRICRLNCLLPCCCSWGGAMNSCPEWSSSEFCCCQLRQFLNSKLSDLGMSDLSKNWWILCLVFWENMILFLIGLVNKGMT